MVGDSQSKYWRWIQELQAGFKSKRTHQRMSSHEHKHNSIGSMIDRIEINPNDSIVAIKVSIG